VAVANCSQRWTIRRGIMRYNIWLVVVLLRASMPAYGAPPPDATGQFHEWFRGLTVPGSPGTACCGVADCRMVESRWNDQTRHFEAKMNRDVFGNSSGISGDSEARQRARYVWMWNWIARFGDKPEIWVEIPEAKVSPASNPTGHAVLCWSTFNPNSNGVLCFVPYHGS
jgi:hypothetical protein